MKKILVADDEVSLRFLITETLAMEGYEIFEAEDGEEALALAREKKPDIILLDVMMPKLTGYQVAEKLTEEKWEHRGIIVMLTAKGQHQDKEKGLASGADYFLTKPFSPIYLLGLIEKILQSSCG
ncbi:response regulator [Clostridiaceae bacterium 35-E11]